MHAGGWVVVGLPELDVRLGDIVRLVLFEWKDLELPLLRWYHCVCSASLLDNMRSQLVCMLSVNASFYLVFIDLRPSPDPPLQAVTGKTRASIQAEVCASGMTWGTFKPLLAEAVVEHLEPIQVRQPTRDEGGATGFCAPPPLPR